jgi:putative transposase
VFFCIHLASGRVHVAGLTANRDRAWIVRPARSVSTLLADEPVPARVLFRDHDRKFVPEFDDVFECDGVAVKPVGPLAPNMNAYAERWVQSIKRECLDRFAVFGVGHLRHLISEYLAHYHAERPHRGLGNRPPTGPPPEPGQALPPTRSFARAAGRAAAALPPAGQRWTRNRPLTSVTEFLHRAGVLVIGGMLWLFAPSAR